MIDTSVSWHDIATRYGAVSPSVTRLLFDLVVSDCYVHF